ncbi:hypothetical protein HaLaN_31001 [Haematococcus lacustris]|uniref:Uncharacterized protein n=1 Tax=Haematococcus lacustris TaxID=44745 RepID=A0A6A0AGV5_HAELA|nr:hypothetical protein HaLaN_31001 [Haematococcus lacustris]
MGQFGSHRPSQDIAFAPARSIAQAVAVSLASSTAAMVVGEDVYPRMSLYDALQNHVTVQSSATGAGGASLVLVCPAQVSCGADDAFGTYMGMQHHNLMSSHYHHVPSYSVAGRHAKVSLLRCVIASMGLVGDMCTARACNQSAMCMFRTGFTVGCPLPTTAHNSCSWFFSNFEVVGA